MSSKNDFSFRKLVALACAGFLALLLTGCASLAPPVKPAPPRVEDTSLEAALVYYQGLAKMTPAELGRERMILVAVHQTPFTQIRMAMLLGHPRVQQDLGKALALLDNVLKSTDPAAAPFQPLAREVADNYLERIKLENQLEKQGVQGVLLNQQLKESQRKAAELQEKLDSLANIEKTLIPRPRAVRSDGVKR